MRRLLLVLACLLVAGLVSAQSVINPRQVELTVSVDHVLVTKYVIGYFQSGASAPVMEVDLGTCTPDAQQKCSFAINVQPVGFGVAYVAKVKAVAGTVIGEWSEPSNPFDRSPGAPGGPLVKK